MMSLLSIIPVIGDLIEKVVPDPEEKMKLKLELAKLADAENQREHEQMLASSETNKIEAGHRSIFVAGWRPYIGWGLGTALIYNTLVAPAFNLGVADLPFLQTVLMGMLGIGAMRSYEKVKGVANDVLPLRKPTPISNPLPAEKPKKGLASIWPF